MKHLQTIITDHFELPDELAPYIPLEEFVLFDIETTGLSHSKTKVILIGYIIYENGSFMLNQLFCENRSEELELLLAFQKVLESRTFCITYNGRAFDIPYLNSRYKLSDLPYTIHKFRNFDIMRLAKRNKEFFNFDDFKLKTVEKFLGIEREDTISGKESVELYLDYEQSHSPELEHKILLHNHEDILYLLQCLELVKHAQYDTLIAELTKKISYKNTSIYLVDYTVKGDKLILQLHSEDYSNHDYFNYGSPLSVAYSKVNRSLEISCPLFEIKVDGIGYKFVDIDLIGFDDLSFNQLTYDQKMAYLVSISKEIQHANVFDLSSKFLKFSNE